MSPDIFWPFDLPLPLRQDWKIGSTDRVWGKEGCWRWCAA